MSGLQRLQARKPLMVASVEELTKMMLSRTGRREGQVVRQKIWRRRVRAGPEVSQSDQGLIVMLWVLTLVVKTQ